MVQVQADTVQVAVQVVQFLTLLSAYKRVQALVVNDLRSRATRFANARATTTGLVMPHAHSPRLQMPTERQH